MSHDRGCYLCGEDRPYYNNCKREDCPKREKNIAEKIQEIGEKVELEDALNKARTRGKEWVKNYDGTPREKVILDMAGYIYEYLEGQGEMGRPTFDELTNPEKDLYVRTARWVYKLAMWSKGINPDG